ncbi:MULTISPECIES: hypothetical protein [unclassified Rhizobium]|uniref:hypothetical protein n=1 Tax=unclassified Rhizobium TaxID=2613769 RepID=UPI0006F52FCA|nr:MULTISPECIES: hypothetical protein [unclassified Rhizobium]KQV33128.1 hypothetical protein ASC86_18380 [Rhizobium sp. Root1212]KRD21588.1 hypothetical protein ASE37_18880 [Rhizobium sp. Root268]
MNWSARELRLTRVQADYLTRGFSSVHQRVTDRTELILESRRMLLWKRQSDGTYARLRSPKGDAALAKFNSREKA